MTIAKAEKYSVNISALDHLASAASPRKFVLVVRIRQGSHAVVMYSAWNSEVFAKILVRKMKCAWVIVALTVVVVFHLISPKSTVKKN